VSEIVDYDKIIVVDGRVDTEGAEPKVLVDHISTNLTRVVALEASPTAGQPSLNPPPAPPVPERSVSGRDRAVR
jgi:hypothetical protein